MTHDHTNPSSENVVKIKLLIMMAVADGRWDEREVALLENLADRFGLDRAELAKVRGNPDLGVREMASGLPQDNAGRINLMGALIKMAYADRKLHPNERKLLVRLGQVLGFDEEAVGGIIEEESAEG